MRRAVRGRQRSRPIVAGFVAAAFVLVACGSAEPADPGDAAPNTEAPDTDTDPSADPDGRTRLVVGIPAEMQSIDAMTVGTGSNAVGLTSIYASLMERGIPYLSTGDVTPGVATEVTGTPDGINWTIKLRDDVYWHDGTRLTAEDVAYTLNTVSSEEFAHGVMHAHFRSVGGDGAVAVDDTTVEVTMKEPDGIFAINAPRLLLIPKHYFEEVGPEGFAEHPIGAGPYKFVEWRHDDVMILEAHEQYFQGPPPIDEVHFRVIPDDAARVAALRAGEIDLMHPLPIDQIPVVESDPDLTYQSVPSVGRMYIQIDTFREPFDNLEVRLALNHAIDKEGIVREILNGQGLVIPAMILPVEPGYNDELEPYAYDPDLARQYLADAGYPNGIGDAHGETELACREGSHAQIEDVCTLIAGMLTDVGIPTAPRIWESAAYAQASNEKSLPPLGLRSDAGGAQYFGYAIINNTRVCGADNNPTTPLRPNPNWGGYYCNPELDQTLYEVNQLVASDMDAAIEKLKEADRILYDDASAGYLWVANLVFGMRANLDFPAPGRDDYHLYYARWTDNPRMAD